MFQELFGTHKRFKSCLSSIPNLGDTQKRSHKRAGKLGTLHVSKTNLEIVVVAVLVELVQFLSLAFIVFQGVRLVKVLQVLGVLVVGHAEVILLLVGVVSAQSAL